MIKRTVILLGWLIGIPILLHALHLAVVYFEILSHCSTQDPVAFWMMSVMVGILTLAGIGGLLSGIVLFALGCVNFIMHGDFDPFY